MTHRHEFHCRRCGTYSQSNTDPYCPTCALTIELENTRAERDEALRYLGIERLQRENAEKLLSKWSQGVENGRRILEAEGYKRRAKKYVAFFAELLAAAEFYLQVDEVMGFVKDEILDMSDEGVDELIETARCVSRFLAETTINAMPQRREIHHETD